MSFTIKIWFANGFLTALTILLAVDTFIVKIFTFI